jgi:hypothetical protein
MTATVTDQPTGFNHPHMTPKQAKWMFDLINSRIGTGPALQGWKGRYFAIAGRSDFEHAIETLKAFPVLSGDAHRPAAATEEGLYRNPADGILYRLRKVNGWETSVSIYSEKSVARRIIDATGEEVKKGTWRKLSAWNSRQILSNRTSGTTILAEWQMTDADKIEYRTGICNFCYRGLIDARSVKHNYGPKCAADHNLPWGE